MTCRHQPGDPTCSSNRPSYYSGSEIPDANRYEIKKVERVGPHLVLQVLYPNCARCSYEGLKTLVFLHVQEFQALQWRRIDPHFRPNKSAAHEAPSPAARFPASEEGWSDALAYARTKK